MEPVDPKFFRTAAEFRRWLARNHASAPVLWLGFWKKDAAEGHHLRRGGGRGALLRLDRRAR